MFTGFPEETITYFLNLRLNNYISFFNETKEVFERDVRVPFFHFIETLAPAMTQIDPAMEVRPAKCLARIRRDMRFTKDKTPFRDHLWLLFRRGGEPRDISVMYWFELSPENLDWGLGFWGENKPAMNALRHKILTDADRIIRMITSVGLQDRALALSGPDWKRMEVPDDVPDTLKPWYIKKQLYLSKQNMTVRHASSPHLVSLVKEDFTALAPIYRLLRACADEPLALKANTKEDL